jgi:hypothetical protein
MMSQNPNDLQNSLTDQNSLNDTNLGISFATCYMYQNEQAGYWGTLCDS